MRERQDTSGLYSWDEHEPHLYDDRADAGASLAGHLLHYRDQRPLVLGIPRGGVPVAREIASRLGAELDVIVARKIGAPHQKELAIGAVTADGTRVLNPRVIKILDVSDAYLEQETNKERNEALARERRFRGDLPPLDLRGRTVIVVDDGLATGATMHACVEALRGQACARIVVAVPVGAADTCAELARLVDQLVCPRMPDPFFAVGAHYASFSQVRDEEVRRLLREYRAQRASGPPLVTHR